MLWHLDRCELSQIDFGCDNGVVEVGSLGLNEGPRRLGRKVLVFVIYLLHGMRELSGLDTLLVHLTVVKGFGVLVSTSSRLDTHPGTLKNWVHSVW